MMKKNVPVKKQKMMNVPLIALNAKMMEKENYNVNPVKVTNSKLLTVYVLWDRIGNLKIISVMDVTNNVLRGVPVVVPIVMGL